MPPPEQPGLEGSSTLLLEGAANIRDLESQYGLVLPRDAGFETLAGFVLARLQKIPSLGESFEYDGHRFTAESVEGNRVARVKVEKLEPVKAAG
jgi:putative hemolysin